VPLKAVLFGPLPGAKVQWSPDSPGAVYQDLGERYFDTRDRIKLARRLVRRLGDSATSASKSNSEELQPEVSP